MKLLIEGLLDFFHDIIEAITPAAVGIVTVIERWFNHIVKLNGMDAAFIQIKIKVKQERCS